MPFSSLCCRHSSNSHRLSSFLRFLFCLSFPFSIGFTSVAVAFRYICWNTKSFSHQSIRDSEWEKSNEKSETQTREEKKNIIHTYRTENNRNRIAKIRRITHNMNKIRNNREKKHSVSSQYSLFFRSVFLLFHEHYTLSHTLVAFMFIQYMQRFTFLISCVRSVTTGRRLGVHLGLAFCAHILYIVVCRKNNEICLKRRLKRSIMECY